MAVMRVFKVNLICSEDEDMSGETISTYEDSEGTMVSLPEDTTHIYVAGNELSCIMKCVHPDSIKTIECLGGIHICH